MITAYIDDQTKIPLQERVAWIFNSRTMIDRRCVISPASLKIFILTVFACLRTLIASHGAAVAFIYSLAFLTSSFNHVFASFAALEIVLCSDAQTFSPVATYAAASRM